jgi:hypothetical protein
LSFFDEDDEPRRSPRPRRGRPAGGVATADSQTLLVRRFIAGAITLVVLVLLVVAVNSCRTSQKKNALKDYNRDVSAIATDSAQQVGAGFFALLAQGNGQPQDLQSAISSFRVQAEQQRRQAENLSVPGDMAGAQQNLLITLEQRRDGLDYIAQRIRSALGDSGDVADKAINEIAGQMEVLLASDVNYQTRVIPFIRTALDDNEIGGQRIVASRFVPSIEWLSPQTIAQQLDQQLTSGAGGAAGEPTGPGLHGNGLVSTSYGDVTLQPGATNRLTYQPGQEFVVKFANQGDNDEFGVKVTVRIKAGTQQVTLTKVVQKIAPKTEAEARLPLDKTPPLGSAAEITVTIAAVPGEKKTDNNTSTYPALFTRG